MNRAARAEPGGPSARAAGSSAHSFLCGAGARRRIPFAIAAGVLAALLLRFGGGISAATALELEAILGLAVWLVFWRRTRNALR